jgi:Flp pilus assembly CpaE family ATPase
MAIICNPGTVAEELIHSIGGHVRRTDALATAAAMLDRDPDEILVVIGPAIATREALAFAADLRLTRPAVGVILASEQVDVGLLSRALQSGVREVVAAADFNGLVAACRRSRELSRQLISTATADEIAPAPEGKIITVFAAKGGCGKTTLAVNLGVVLSRGAGRRVCVVDLDLAFGDVAISVQLDPVRTIVDGLPMSGHLDLTGASSLLTHYRPGLDMLLAPVTPGDAEKVPAGLVGELLTVLRGMFDYIVVDTPAHFSEHVLTAMDISTLHVLLTTPDVSALKNLRVTLDMLDLLSYPREIRSLVLNRSDSKVGLSVEDVERAVRCPIAAHIPSSRAVPISLNQGKPITMASAGHPVSQAITGFAQQRVIGGPVPAKRGPSLSLGKRRAG